MKFKKKEKVKKKVRIAIKENFNNICAAHWYFNVTSGTPNHDVDHHSALPDENSEESGQPKCDSGLLLYVLTMMHSSHSLRLTLFCPLRAVALLGGVHCNARTAVLTPLLPAGAEAQPAGVANLPGP